MEFTKYPVRYLGYGSALGEALRLYVSNDTVNALYALTALFILGHVITVLSTGNVPEGIITLLFELLATAFIPTFLIKHLVRVLVDVFQDLGLSSDFTRPAAVLLCVCAIAAMSVPLDKLINNLLDDTVRKVLK